MLKVSTRVRYGLRALVALAGHRGNGPLSMQAMAESQGLSRKYLHALLSALRQAGLVGSVRGAAGGYVLSRAPEEISLAEVFEALEGPIRLVDCDAEGCGRLAGCPTAALWSHLSELLRRDLGERSLADLAGRKKEEKA